MDLVIFWIADSLLGLLQLGIWGIQEQHASASELRRLIRSGTLDDLLS